jgi:hypothetical protein
VQQHYKRRSDTEEHRRLPRRAPRTTCVRAVAWRTHGAPFARLWHLSGLHMPSLTHAIPPPPHPPAPLPPSSSSCIHTNTASPSLCTHTYLHGPALASTPPSQPELGGNPVTLTPCVRAPAWRASAEWLCGLPGFLGHLGLNTVQKPKGRAKNPLNGARQSMCPRVYCLPPGPGHRRPPTGFYFWGGARAGFSANRPTTQVATPFAAPSKPARAPVSKPQYSNWACLEI